MASWRISLCGRLELATDHGAAAAALRGRQTRLLLGYLVLHRARPVSRDELIDAVWPYEAPARPGAALSTLLCHLRRAVGPEALHGRTELQLLVPDDAWIDVEAAIEATARAQAALDRGAWRSAMGAAQAGAAIVERELLPGLDAPWLEVRRRELHELLLDALEAEAAAGIRLGGAALGAAVRAARRLVELAPLRETGHVALMEVHAERDRPAEGLRVFDELRRVLRDELGAVPGPAALRVHARLLGADGASTPASASRDAARRPSLPPLVAAPQGTRFVGRRRELERLGTLLSRAGDVPRQLVLIAGEPGIGKTRLALRFGALAHEAGAIVLAGRTDEAGIVPYGPFAEALPEVLAQTPTADRDADPALARLALFDAFVDALAGHATERPVVLLLEDVHWADESTLLLLEHVLRARRQRRLLMVASYRDVELHRRPALARVLSSVGREVPVERVHLHALARADADELAGEAARRALPQPVLDAIHAEAEGSPFFVLELARHVADAGGRKSATLPDGIRELIERRVADLPGPAGRLLRAAAAVGREFDLGLVERLEELDEREVVPATEEAVAARLLHEVPGRPDRYSFSHALVNATLYSGLGAARRVRLHERIGRALEVLHGEGRPVPAADIAAHKLAALPRSDVRAAVGWARAAAAEATKVAAYEEAVRPLRRAWRALEEHGPCDQAVRASLATELGHAERRAGRMPEARERFAQAIEAARATGDADVLAQAVLGYGGGFFESAFVDATMVSLLEEALARLAERDGPLRLELLARLAKAVYYSEDDADATRREALIGDAIAMARRLAGPRPMLVALEARHFALCSPDNLDERLADAREIIALAERAGDPERDLLGRYFLIADLVESGAVEDCDRELAEYGERAERARLPLHRWYHRRHLAMRALLDGRLDDAERLAAEAHVLGLPVEPRTASMHFGAQTWVLRALRGELAQLEDAVRGFVAAYPRVAAWRAGVVAVLLAQGRTDEAAAAFREFTASGFRNIPRDAIWSTTAGIAADLVVGGLGDAADARTLLALIRPYASRNAVTGEAIVCTGPLSLYAGRLALHAGDPAEAARLLEDALERSERMGARLYTVQAADALAAARKTSIAGAPNSRA